MVLVESERESIGEWWSLCKQSGDAHSFSRNVEFGILNLAYGGDDEAFLQKVVTPIHKTIAKEAKRSREGKSKHSVWRNYDDLNEYFW
ncbi:unnamed protein product [Microthlaspi erraticum]|uniref:1,3-beta-glucan synthase component FKS1-like domain-containing protein n=1 Tax=Microthlaspi erraticum TaxID=1685480 RepID=A0A6D2IM33_9BRAS|nr:unnamed protein product [Microthlaspi erraticum]